MSVRRLRAGLVGCGAQGVVHARALASLPHLFELVGVADPDADRRSDVIDVHPDATGHRDLRSLVEAAAPDLLILSTWPAQHEEQVIEALELGARWILCEKSLALTSESAERMRDAAVRAGATVAEALMWRSSPRARAMQRMVEHGEVGALERVRATFHLRVPPEADNWRNRPGVGGGVAYDFTPYPVSALGAFTRGAPRRVHARQAVDAAGVARQLDALVEYDEVIGVIESSHTSGYRQSLELTGSRAVIVAEHMWTSATDPDVEFVTAGDFGIDDRRTAQVEPEDPYVAQLRDAHRSIVEGVPARVPIEESIRNLRLLELILESARVGRAVETTEVAP
jgi:D-xylose 1-dehydrogenase (NADP+, D-xylono-1,5-lactone-forming)